MAKSPTTSIVVSAETRDAAAEKLDKVHVELVKRLRSYGEGRLYQYMADRGITYTCQFSGRWSIDPKIMREVVA